MKKVSAVIICMITGCWLASSQVLRIDSVTVDSVWNTDTVQFGNSVLRRDIKISFVPTADDSVVCVVDLSLDSGRTWLADRDLFEVGGKACFGALPHRRSSVVVRLLSGDTPNVAFRVTARKDTASINRCRIASQLPGWQEDSASYAYYNDPYRLRDRINGYYRSFSQFGFVDVFYQALRASDTLHTVSAMCMDLATRGRATDLYTYRMASFQVTLPGYDTSSARARKIIGGYTVIGHFNHFYHEFSLLGYDLSTSDSLLVKMDAAGMLDFYREQAGRL